MQNLNFNKRHPHTSMASTQCSTPNNSYKTSISALSSRISTPSTPSTAPSTSMHSIAAPMKTISPPVSSGFNPFFQPLPPIPTFSNLFAAFEFEETEMESAFNNCWQAWAGITNPKHSSTRRRKFSFESSSSSEEPSVKPRSCNAQSLKVATLSDRSRKRMRDTSEEDAEMITIFHGIEAGAAISTEAILEGHLEKIMQGAERREVKRGRTKFVKMEEERNGERARFCVGGGLGLEGMIQGTGSRKGLWKRVVGRVGKVLGKTFQD